MRIWPGSIRRALALAGYYYLGVDMASGPDRQAELVVDSATGKVLL